MSDGRRPVHSALLSTAAIAVPTVLLFLLLEGCSSAIAVGYDAAFNRLALTERLQSYHDSELGWVNRPNLILRDLYGPGIHLSTDSRGFRTGREAPEPPGRPAIRVVCSGDSFTAGFGVGDGEDWCSLLRQEDGRLAAVNLAIGGYGVDQAYLRYRRERESLPHDLHLFAFITEDFRRMMSDRFLGHAKPRLTVDGDSLVITNYPVPYRGRLARFAEVGRSAARELRVVELLSRATARRAAPQHGSPARYDRADAERLMAAILADLARMSVEDGSALVLIYLPTMLDASGDGAAAWRDFISAEAERNRIHFVDLVNGFQDLPHRQVVQLFIADGLGSGHYSVEGNRYVGRRLHHELVERGVLEADEE
jgi:hypothetical protein